MADILIAVFELSRDCCCLEVSNEGIYILFTKRLECTNMRIPSAEKREKISQAVRRPIERFRYPARGQLRGHIALHRRAKHFWHTEEIDVVTVPVRFIRKAGNISCVPSIFGKLGIKQRRHAKSRGAIDQAKGVRFHVYLCSCGVRVRLTATSALSQAERRAPWEGCMEVWYVC